jgi:hypothetical protein
MSKADDRAELNRLLSTFKGDVQRCRPGQSRMRAMPNSSTLLADKKSVHADLMRLALAGQITYYGALGAAVGKHAQWPKWTEVLDGISDDELAKGNPDITDLVLSATTGWPSRISRQFTNGKPTDQQREKAQRGLDGVFSHYCPGKQAPILPQRKHR